MGLERGYEFTDEGPQLRPDFAYDDLRGVAAHPMVTHGVVEIDLPRGKRAFNPASTKTVIHGPARVRYEFDRAGIDARVT